MKGLMLSVLFLVAWQAEVYRVSLPRGVYCEQIAEREFISIQTNAPIEEQPLRISFDKPLDSQMKSSVSGCVDFIGIVSPLMRLEAARLENAQLRSELEATKAVLEVMKSTAK